MDVFKNRKVQKIDTQNINKMKTKFFKRLK